MRYLQIPPMKLPAPTRSTIFKLMPKCKKKAIEKAKAEAEEKAKEAKKAKEVKKAKEAKEVKEG